MLSSNSLKTSIPRGTLANKKVQTRPSCTTVYLYRVNERCAAEHYTSRAPAPATTARVTVNTAFSVQRAWIYSPEVCVLSARCAQWASIRLECIGYIKGWDRCSARRGCYSPRGKRSLGECVFAYEWEFGDLEIYLNRTVDLIKKEDELWVVKNNLHL